MADPRIDWLDQLLREDAAAVVYPSTPTFANPAGAVLPRSRAPLWRLAALATVILLVVGTLLAVPRTRTAFAHFFGRVQGERIEVLPTPAAGATASPFPTNVPFEQIAVPIAVGDVSARLHFTPALPNRPDAPRYFVLPYAGVGVLVLVYPDVTVWETPNFIYGKGVSEGTSIQELTVKGQPAYWIEGGSRIVRILRPNGEEVVGTQRTVDKRTLIWRGELLTYRLEGDLGLADALAVAESLP